MFVLRMTGGTIVGIVVAVVAVFVWQVIGHTIFPVPAGLDPSKPEELSAYVEALPLAAKAWVVAGWLFATLIGGLIARALSGKTWSAWVVAIAILGATVANFVMLPHPLWMIAAGVLAPLLAGAAVGGLPRLRRAAESAATEPGD